VGQDGGPSRNEASVQGTVVRVWRHLGCLAHQGIGAAARLAHQQPGSQQHALGHWLALEQRQQHLRSPARHFIAAKGSCRQWWRNESALGLVIEARHRDVGGDAQPAALERLHRAERHVVAGRDQRVEPNAPDIEQFPGRGGPAALLKIAFDDQGGVMRDAVFGQHIQVGLVALLGLGLRLRPADKCDARQGVEFHQVGDHIMHALVVVQHDARDSFHGRMPDGDHRERLVAPAKIGDHWQLHPVAEGARPDHQAVHVLRASEFIDDIGLRLEAVGRAEGFTGEADDMCAVFPRCALHAFPNGLAVGITGAVRQHADGGARPVRPQRRFSRG